MTPVAAPSRKRTTALGEELVELELSSGLRVIVVPKRGYARRYALLGTAYGSIDNDFTSPTTGRRMKVPPGIAHFLEHKMFEKEDGDVMDKFAAYGCSTNAMTSFNHTGYLIECTEGFDRSLELLVDFVTRPYFTPELVDKEKGIIAEEIRMYQDDPGWCGFMGVLENLYRRHPVAVDIAGTVESIQEITADDLHLCHDAFYRPSNMHLAVAGDVNPDRIAAIAERVIARNRPDCGAAPERFCPQPPKRRARRTSEASMAVASRKLHLGWRTDPDAVSVDVMTLEIALDLFFGALLSKANDLHRDLHESGLVDDSFSFSVNVEPEFGFVMVTGDSPDPAKLEKKLIAGVARALEDGIDEAALRRARRGLYGSFVRSFNAVGSICWNLIDCHVKRFPYLDYGKTVMKLDAERTLAIVREALRPELCSSHVVVPRA